MMYLKLSIITNTQSNKQTEGVLQLPFQINKRSYRLAGKNIPFQKPNNNPLFVILYSNYKHFMLKK